MKANLNEGYDAPPPYPGTETDVTIHQNQSGSYMPPSDPYNSHPPYQGAPQYGFQTVNVQPTGITTTSASIPVVVVSSQLLSDSPIQMTCGFCSATVITRTSNKIGGLAWLIFALCCLFGCWFGCCLIPFCIDACQDVDHFCPNCNRKLGCYHRM